MDFRVQDVIFLAASKCGVVRMNEQLAPHELLRGMQVANIMLGEWSAESCMLRSTTPDSHALTGGTGSYTIGIGATINTAKPIKILNAIIRDSNNVDTPVDIVPINVYFGIGDKTVQARPVVLYYDPGVTQQVTQTGTIYLSPIPDSSTSYTLVIESEKLLTEFTSLVAQITMEPMYYAALVNGLAARLFRHYHSPKVSIPVDIAEEADTSKRRVMTINSSPIVMVVDVPGTQRGEYDINTGRYII
jgi:hypothetical protein